MSGAPEVFNPERAARDIYDTHVVSFTAVGVHDPKTHLTCGTRTGDINVAVNDEVLPIEKYVEVYRPFLDSAEVAAAMSKLIDFRHNVRIT